ncbi:gfo/Idh/MocA family oxidoreductase [Desertihabitans brevis]|uniref:Gfo/Idh/MocA family oxidoreductase n=1 Tax=Desertihabitans brevis TaxID=2268447 RepID=A0A367YZC3_9ACTN|nr:Gfo/Idh/MocA family oxidoreductase [Desertihabitans brevis]RCK71246.1 gfo/Idh/MocA family oxidoreductase [Desertihabitans brevis]
MIKVAVIGTGNISPAHLEAYRSFPDRCQVVALADIVPQKAEAARERFGLTDARVHASHTELLERGDVDLVSVCTPPSTHEQISVDALSAGVHVLCEKPMAPSLAACDAILAAEQAGGALFSSVAQNRFRDDVVRFKAALDSGLAGPVSRVEVTSAWWRGLPYYDLWWRGTWEQEGGGCTLNHAVHHIDLLLWLMGAPQAVTAVLTNAAHENAEIEDLSVAVLSYQRALATVTSSVVDHGERQQMVVQGRAASIALDGDVVADVTQPNGFPVPGGDPALVERLRTLAAEQPPLAHTGHTGQVDDVLTAIEQGRRPVVDGHDGRRTIELITAIYRAGVERRTVDLPLAADDPWSLPGTLTERAPRFFTKTASVAEQAGAISVSGAPTADTQDNDKESR